MMCGECPPAAHKPIHGCFVAFAFFLRSEDGCVFGKVSYYSGIVVDVMVTSERALLLAHSVFALCFTFTALSKDLQQ